jgi:site-specific DNA-methyltransferase (adenine-specific)
MNKRWDYDVPSVEFWKEVFRVLKPGGHVLSFGGTRTYHRMVVNIEDAGFEIRDQIQWIYGSGFPKSLNIGKAVDKIEGNEREVVGAVKRHDFKDPQYIEQGSMMKTDNSAMIDLNITKGQSEYEGWGTSLKPANEPICVARKPLSEKSVAENVLKWGTGGINVDGCRIGNETIKTMGTEGKQKFRVGENNKVVEFGEHEGRFPANIIFECICDEVIKGEKGEIKSTNRIRKGEAAGGLDISENRKAVEGIDNYNDKGDIHTNPDCPCRILDEQSGVSKSNCKSGFVEGKEAGQMYHRHEKPNNNFKKKMMVGDYSDKGGASRFFYQAKVSKAERNMGLDGFEEKIKTSLQVNMADGVMPETHKRFSSVVKNNHITVKPVNLMSYLCRLITPKNGIVLDAFMGSGSTGIAAQLEGFRFVGMEMDSEYFKIAEARIENFEKYRKFIKK